jgi:4-oxalomesaconate tautomerase
VLVDKAQVDYGQNCGNLLADVGPFAIKREVVSAQPGTTPVRIFTVNTGQIAVANVLTPEGKVTYVGNAKIDGVPGSSSPIII